MNNLIVEIKNSDEMIYDIITRVFDAVDLANKDKASVALLILEEVVLEELRQANETRTPHLTQMQITNSLDLCRWQGQYRSQIARQILYRLEEDGKVESVTQAKWKVV